MKGINNVLNTINHHYYKIDYFINIDSKFKKELIKI